MVGRETMRTLEQCLLFCAEHNISIFFEIRTASGAKEGEGLTICRLIPGFVEYVSLPATEEIMRDAKALHILLDRTLKTFELKFMGGGEKL
jgi:hypothetical protein